MISHPRFDVCIYRSIVSFSMFLCGLLEKRITNQLSVTFTSRFLNLLFVIFEATLERWMLALWADLIQWFHFLFEVRLSCRSLSRAEAVSIRPPPNCKSRNCISIMVRGFYFTSQPKKCWCTHVLMFPLCCFVCRPVRGWTSGQRCCCCSRCTPPGSPPSRPAVEAPLVFQGYPEPMDQTASKVLKERRAIQVNSQQT